MIENFYRPKKTICLLLVLLFISSILGSHTSLQQRSSRLNEILKSRGESQEAPPPGLGHPEIQEITKNVLAVTGLYHSAEKGFSTNAGIIFTPQSVVFIDAGMTIASGEFLWAIAQERMKANEDWYLILTHHHGDHVFGMRVMKEKGAKVVAHRIVNEWFKDYDGRRYKNFLIKRQGWSVEKGDSIFGDVVLSAPDQSIDQDTIMNIDGEEIHILVTPGHTTDSISVYHPGSKTLFAADTIYEGTRPNTRFGGPEEWKIWIAQLERLKKLEIDTIVPGHGKLCGKEEIDRHIDYLKSLL